MSSCGGIRCGNQSHQIGLVLEELARRHSTGVDSADGWGSFATTVQCCQWTLGPDLIGKSSFPGANLQKQLYENRATRCCGVRRVAVPGACAPGAEVPQARAVASVALPRSLPQRDSPLSSEEQSRRDASVPTGRLSFSTCTRRRTSVA